METNLNKKTIRDAILDYCEAKEISHSELATKADVSAATISNIINDKWENIATRLWRKLENVVCNDHLNDLLKTRDYKAVFTICDTAKKLKRMVGLIADTGWGKQQH